MSTHTLEGDDLEALLARVPEELGPHATIVAANKLRTGGIAGFFSKEAYEVVVEVADEPRRPAAVQDYAFPQLGDGDSEGDGDGDGEGDGAAVEPLVEPVLEPAVEPRGRRARADRDEGFAAVLGRMVRDAGAGDRGPGTGRGPDGGVERPMVPARWAATARRQVGPPPAPAFDRRCLSRVGLPDALARTVAATTGDATMALLHLFDRLPRPDALPQQQGSVIAVLGGRQAAIDVAEQLAEQLGTSPSSVLVATRTSRAKVVEERRIDSVDTALERRRSWRRRRRPTVVAVDAAVGRRQTAWAAELLEALEPTQVWGVVEATRKAEDIRDWAIHVGGLDALAVTGLDDTASPASVLGVGVPVGLLDGEDATPLRWTSLLTARILEAA